MFRLISSGNFIRFFFLFLPCVLSAQKDTVEKKFYYEGGALSSQGFMVGDKPVGYWRTYYESGLLKSEGNRENTDLSGVWKFYNESEDIIKEITYAKGKKNGPTRIYNDSCQIVATEIYENDTLQGTVTQYFGITGSVRATIPYDEGQKNGVAYEYDSSGRIITMTTYQHGFVKKKEEINRRNNLGKQGTWKDWYLEGELHKEMRYKNDILHGYYKEYDRDGKLITALLYIEGIVQENPEELTALEVRRQYFENGDIRWEGTYNYLGQEEGTIKQFARNGDVEEARIYSKGMMLAKGRLNRRGERIGAWEFYYPEGNIRAKGEYKDGLQVEEWEYYHMNGKIEQRGKYNKEGKPHGEWRWFYINSQPWREENFWKGKEEGEVIEYSDSGTVITKGQYIDGKKDGEWFYELGDHKEEGKYIEGLRSGDWVYYYPNGKINFKGEFLNGDPNGKHLFYYPNGRIKREEYYELGIEEGIWHSYDEYGNMLLTTEYQGGIEVKLDKKKLR